MGAKGPRKARGLSIREYVAHREEKGLPGANKSAVQKALKAGRIRYISGDSRMGIDPAQADRDWEANTSPARQHPAAAEASRESLQSRVGNGLPALPGMVPDYQVSRARREHYEAEMARLDLAERVGELIRVALAETEIQSMTSTVRQRLLVRAPRLAPELVNLVREAEGDEVSAIIAVERALEAADREVLTVMERDPMGQEAAQEPAEDAEPASE